MHGEGPPRVVLGHSTIASVDIMLNLNQRIPKQNFQLQVLVEARVCVCKLDVEEAPGLVPGRLFRVPRTECHGTLSSYATAVAREPHRQRRQ